MTVSRWRLGIDVGGTKIAAGAVDLDDGMVSHRREIPTRPDRGLAAVVSDIWGLAGEVSRAMSWTGQIPGAIGIGLPELVDGEGQIRSARLGNWSLVSLDRPNLAAPAVVTSDVRAAARAEARFGAGRGFPLFVYVSIGTGISSSVVLNGEPLIGARGGALVLSSGTLSVPCETDDMWSRFVLEAYASGPALVRRYEDRGGRRAATAQEVLLAASGGDTAAIAVVDTAARALGSAIAWLVNVVDPDVIVIGGGLGLAPGRFHEATIAAIRQHIWNPSARDLPILSAALGADAGLIGAAIIAAQGSSAPGLHPTMLASSGRAERR